MRIATLSNASVVHTERWVAHFRARGHDVRVWSLEPGPPALGAERLPAPPLPGALRYPLAAPALRRALARFAPDVVDAHYVPNYGLLGVLAGRRPLSVAAWGSDLLIAGPSNPLQRARARFVLRHAALVLADSGNLAAAAIALGAPRERVRAIPWGVDRTRFRPGAAREPGLVLSTRMHEPVYDMPVLIAGVAEVMSRRPDAFLAVAGDGSLRGSLERLAAERLPAGRYRFLGRLAPDALADWLGRAEVFVSASRSDSTSQSLLEAMAAGAVPVVSDLEGNREWVSEGQGARLFRVGDAHGFATALQRVLEDSAWSGAARAWNAGVIAARGDWPTNLARIEDAFAALAAGRPLPPAGAAT